MLFVRRRDLHFEMEIDAILFDGKHLCYQRDYSTYHVLATYADQRTIPPCEEASIPLVSTHARFGTKGRP